LGLYDAEVKYKLKDIDTKLRELGGRLELPLLDGFNVKADAAEIDEDSDKSDENETNLNSEKDGKS